MKHLMLFLILTFLSIFVPDLQADEYIAFSLKVAQERIISIPKGEDYRKLHPEIFYLGGITVVRGLVFDQKTGDTILVGERDSNRAPLTLDDFVVALRARFIHGKWPLVSIDPTEETKKTEMQIVRFEGGIEDTQFGQDLFDADYRLKRIGLGLLSSGVPGVQNYWDLGMEETRRGITKSEKISSRFWFYPVLPNVNVREDVVAIKGLKVAVFTEVLAAEVDGKNIENLSTFQDLTGDRFAKMVSDNFDKIASVHPSLSGVQGLAELVALAKAIEEMEEKADLSYWLKDYQVKHIQTKKEVKVLRRSEEYRVSMAGMIGTGHRKISGGVQLMAIALRLKAGEVAALKEAVLKTRPKSDSMSWSFLVGEWLIPTSLGMHKIEDIVLLISHAIFLCEQKRYEDAITLYGKIIDLNPDLEVAYYNRGNAYAQGKRHYDQAISDYTRAIEINSGYAEAYNNRGAAYAQGKRHYDQAISDYTRAIEINPGYAEAHINRGIAHSNKGQHDQAIDNYNKAIEINPMLDEAYASRGTTYHNKGQYGQSIVDYNRAIGINPKFAKAYSMRAAAYGRQGHHDQAIADYNKALEIDPGLAAEVNPILLAVYLSRGRIYHSKGYYSKAISDYSKLLEIDSKSAFVYLLRGDAYYNRDLYGHAISDYEKALQIDPMLALAHYHKAVAFEKVGHIEEAIEAYKAFVQHAAAHHADLIAHVKVKIKDLTRRYRKR